MKLMNNERKSNILRHLSILSEMHNKQCLMDIVHNSCSVKLPILQSMIIILKLKEICASFCIQYCVLRISVINLSH